jgi:cytochrome c oxidase subunit II
MLKRAFAVLWVAAMAALLGACGGGSETDEAAPADPQAAAGMQIHQNSCAGCHSTDGSRRSGPSFSGLAGSQVQLDDGSTVEADDEYLRRAIQEPDAEIVDGYNKGIMSNVVREGQFDEEETNQLIAYIKTLR